MFMRLFTKLQIFRKFTGKVALSILSNVFDVFDVFDVSNVFDVSKVS